MLEFLSLSSMALNCFQVNKKICLCAVFWENILGFDFFLSTTVTIIVPIVFQSLLVCKVSAEKSAGSLMKFPLYVISCSSLGAFKILSLL